MINKKGTGLNLLPLDIQMFAAPGQIGQVTDAGGGGGGTGSTTSSTLTETYTSSLTGSISSGDVLTNRDVRVVYPKGMYDSGIHKFNGISTSNTTLIIPTGGSALFGTNGISMVVAYKDNDNTYYWYRTLDDSTNGSNILNFISNLPVGLYYIWVDGASRLSFQIVQSSNNFNIVSNEVKKNFVVWNKISNNEAVILLKWSNPSTVDRYVKVVLSDSDSPGTTSKYRGSSDVFRCYAVARNNRISEIRIPYIVPAGQTDSINDTLKLLVYVSTDQNILNTMVSSAQFNTNTAVLLKTSLTKDITVKNIQFKFPGSGVSDINLNISNIQLTKMPTIPGYASVNWENSYVIRPRESRGISFVGGANISSADAIHVIGSINNIQNNMHYFNMYKADATYQSYNINSSSILPMATNENNSATYTFSPIETTQMVISKPTRHVASIFDEYEFKGWSLSRQNHGGTAPTIRNTTGQLQIPSSSYGDIDINAVWDYKHWGVAGSFTVSNDGYYKLDIDGVRKAFGGYTYKLYDEYQDEISSNALSFTSNATNSNIKGTVQAKTKVGYEYKSYSIIKYPFDKDGLIDTTSTFGLLTDDRFVKDTSIIQHLRGNSGTFSIDYDITKYMAGEIQIGIETKLKNYPVYIKLGKDIISFDFNGQTFNVASPSVTYVDGKKYILLTGATFNVSRSFSYTLTNISAKKGFKSSNQTITINGQDIVTDNDAEVAAFRSMADAEPINYTIYASSSTGVNTIDVTPNVYNVMTSSFVPSLKDLTYKFGYSGPLSILGSISEDGAPFSSMGYITGSLPTVVKPSYNNYLYIVSADKTWYNINKSTTSSIYGLKSYSFNKEKYQMSSSKQRVDVSYVMNDGYEVNTLDSVSVTGFTNSSGSVISAQDITYGGFNIPSDVIGDAIFTPKVTTVKKTNYSISTDISGMRGVNSFSVSPDNYVIDSGATPRKFTTTLELSPNGYSNSTDSLIITGGSAISDTKWNSFNIGTNGFGNITVRPGAPIPINYDIKVETVNVPGWTSSGISSASISPSSYNIESTTVTPVISAIYNTGFNNFVSQPLVAPITKGSYGEKKYTIYGTPIKYNISVRVGSGVSSYEFDSSTFTSETILMNYTIMDPNKDVYINNVKVVNKLYSEIPMYYKVGTIPSGSYGHKILQVSGELKNNSITKSLPIGYESMTLSDDRYTATRSASKTISIAYAMEKGYDVPTSVVAVSGLKNSTGDASDVISKTWNSFVIPLSSWGDIIVTPGAATAGNYYINYPKTGLSVGIKDASVSPGNYKVTDSYPKTFDIVMNASEGYKAPSAKLGGQLISDQFTMDVFDTNDQNVTFISGSPIDYNISSVMGEGYSSYRYNEVRYSDSRKLDTFNITSSKTVLIDGFIKTNNLYKDNGSNRTVTIAVGTIGDIEIPFSTTLKTGSISTGKLPYGIDTMGLSLTSYDTVIDDTTRSVEVSYVMNDGYEPPASFAVVGSKDGLDVVVPITPTNASSFNIASHTYGDLIVTAAEPAKKDYSILSGTLPMGINSLSYSIDSSVVNKYQISLIERSVKVSYVMNNGYTAPSGDLYSVSLPATVVDNNTFSLPVNAFGNITVVPSSPSLTDYSIIKSAGALPNGMSSMVISPEAYNINHMASTPVEISYGIKTGWSSPTANPKVTGSSTTITSTTGFDILKDGYGPITVTPANPILKVYDINISANPKEEAISRWEVSPSTYTVTDTYPKTFTVTAHKISGYEDPYVTVDGIELVGNSFTMSEFSETSPVLEIVAGDKEPFTITLNYSADNSGITSATITPSGYNIETNTFTPVVSNVVTKITEGYEDNTKYTLTPTLFEVTKGSVGNISHVIKATPTEYSITKGIGTGIASANISRNKYNVEQTPISDISWSSIIYKEGYHKFVSDDLSIASGQAVHKTFNISATPINYKISIVNPVGSGILSYIYDGTRYTTSADVDEYNIESVDKLIILEEITYGSGFEGPDEISYGVIENGSTGDRQFVLGSGGVKNVFIDVDSWTSPDPLIKHYKIKSFVYNGKPFEVNSRDKIWIDYFVDVTPIYNVTLTDIIYEAGYDGPKTKNFGNVIPSSIGPNDTGIDFILNDTTLVQYNATLRKDNTITKFSYFNNFELGLAGIKTEVTNNNDIVVTFTIQSDIEIKAVDIVYAEGYQGNEDNLNPDNISYFINNKYNTTSNVTKTVKFDPTVHNYKDYTVTINDIDPSNRLVSFEHVSTPSKTYNIATPTFNVNATNLVYESITNSDGTWKTYVGPTTYGISGSDARPYGYNPESNTHSGKNLDWKVTKGSTGNKVFNIPVDSIVKPNEFLISYTNKSITDNGYTSTISPVITYYTYGIGATVIPNNTNSFTVVNNTVMPLISQRLANGNPIHYSYKLNSVGNTVISNTDVGNKTIGIVWSEVIFTLTIKDRYEIKDVYGINPVVYKSSPISGKTTDEIVFVINYSLNSEAQNYTISNNKYNKTSVAREGWTFINAGKPIGMNEPVTFTGTDKNISKVVIPANYYDNVVTSLLYEPNTYKITLSLGQNELIMDNTISIRFDHEIDRWTYNNIPTKQGTDLISYAFDGFKDSSGVEVITQGGLYLFNKDTYSTNVTFYSKWIERKDFITYDATNNISVGNDQMQEITSNGVASQRLIESMLSPYTVQSLITNTSMFNKSNISTNSKYVFDLSNPHIKLRKVLSTSLNGYTTIEISNNTVNQYITKASNLDVNGNLVNLLEFVGIMISNGIVASELSKLNISVLSEEMIVSKAGYNMATSDIFRVLFKISPINKTSFTYWVFDIVLPTSGLPLLKEDISAKQDLFLISTPSGMKEITSIEGNNDLVMYNRRGNILENSGILTNWEDVISGQSKNVDVYGVTLVNKDKVYGMDFNVKSLYKSESMSWSPASSFTKLNIPYNSNIKSSWQGSSILNYHRMPLNALYANKIDIFGTKLLGDFKVWSVTEGKLVVDSLDTKLGPVASSRGALSSAGEFFLPTLYYTVSVNNANSASVRTFAYDQSKQKQFTYTPVDRNIGQYVVQGPVSDNGNNLRFLLNTSDNVVKVHVGKLDPNNLNRITSLVALTKDTNSNWYIMSSPFAKMSAGVDYYTIVIETATKLMYNNLLIYKMFRQI